MIGPVTGRPLEWLVPAMSVLITAVIAVTQADALPDPMATRWNRAGIPSGPSPRSVELGVGVLVVGLGAAFGAIADRAPTTRAARTLVVLSHVASVGWALHRWRAVSANLGATHWSESHASVNVPTMLLCMLIAGLLGWLASHHRSHDP